MVSIKKIVEDNSSVWDMLNVARICAEYGDLVEIGAGEGNTTLELLKIVSNLSEIRNGLVIVIDPFEDLRGHIPSDYTDPYPYKKFLEKIAGFEKFLFHIKEDSRNFRKTFKINGEASFVFIDGLQFKDAVLSDLQLADSMNPLVICLDDFERLTEKSQVPLAVEEFMFNNNNKYELFHDNAKIRRKAFLVRK